jgi:hypothetical protein
MNAPLLIELVKRCWSSNLGLNESVPDDEWNRIFIIGKLRVTRKCSIA